MEVGTLAVTGMDTPAAGEAIRLTGIFASIGEARGGIIRGAPTAILTATPTAIIHLPRRMFRSNLRWLSSRSRRNPLTGITVRIRKAIIRTSKTARAGG